MIISKTPYRISFFGGGTDYPQWYLKEGGAVLSTTIDKYCYLSCRYFPPFFNIKHRVVWSHIESVGSRAEILHPAVREGLKYLDFDDSVGLEIHHQGDLPARSGMGSSSAFSVGLINALTALKGKQLNKHELATHALRFEQDILREVVGSQDQVAVAYGGLNIIRFLPNGDFKVEPIGLSSRRIQELESRLILLFTGTHRLASEVARGVTADMEKKSRHLKRMHQMVDEGEKILKGNDNLDVFGELLHESWSLKKELSNGVTNEKIDQIYETARSHGAIGGKLLGAGSSGFMVFYVPSEKQKKVMEALSHYLWVPFAFEREGSTVIYHGSKSEFADRAMMGSAVVPTAR